MTDPHATLIDAQRLAGRLPPLLAAAERVAATVSPGTHGRGRAGQGESFWQFRPLVPGDVASRVDWRRSARSTRAYVRETEWEAAQTVHLWRDPGPGMDWRSASGLPRKADRAGLILLALAALLIRGGERVGLLGAPARHPTLARLAAVLPRHAVPLSAAAPPRHAAIVLFGDFLAPVETIRDAFARLASIPVAGHVLQVLDPAEIDLPYAGHVRFQAGGRDGAEPPVAIARAEGVRDAYRARLRDHVASVATLCRTLRWSHALHVTAAPPRSALLALHERLAGSGWGPRRAA